MPKLNKEIAQAVEEMPEPGKRMALPAGRYRLRLENVEEKTTKAGDPAWRVKFSLPAKGSTPKRGDRQGPQVEGSDGLFMWLSMKEQARFRLNEFFFAMEYTPDSDTDEMIGDFCLADLEVETYKGEDQNNITRLYPINEENSEDVVNP